MPLNVHVLSIGKDRAKSKVIPLLDYPLFNICSFPLPPSEKPPRRVNSAAGRSFSVRLSIVAVMVLLSETGLTLAASLSEFPSNEHNE